MNQLVPFQFESQAIRVVVVNDQPMFSARAVALALGYENPSKAYQDHCKRLKKLSHRELLELKWGTPNPQGEYVMPESDVYRLIVKSAKPEAERFERWVFEEVLPSIRKTGSYSVKPTPRPNTAQLKSTFRDFLDLAKLCGFEDNFALLSADKATKKFTDYSVLNLLEATHLKAD